MYEPLRRRVLAVLKVPPEPHPPLGDPASLRVFRAGRNYLRLRLATWAFAQVLALAVIIFWTVTLLAVEERVHEQKALRAARPAAPTEADTPQLTSPANPPSATPPPQPNWQHRFEDTVKAIAASGERAGQRASRGGRQHFGGWFEGYKQSLVEVALLLPDQAFLVIWGLKIFGFSLYLLQIPLTYTARRLDYEMRWYMVTDRSLRLRHGVWKVSESTMSFANIQQVVVSQNPLQRLLGLADVKVKSAGGGSGQHAGNEVDDMHTGLFHSVTHAPEIRDLIIERLRRFREAGLGDPDEKSARQATGGASPTSSSSPTLAAAQELLAEAKALRAALSHG